MPTPKTKSYYELELNWLYSIKSNLFNKIDSIINSNFSLIAVGRQIERPKIDNNKSIFKFFESVKALGVTDLDSAKELTHLIAIEQREEWKRQKKKEEKKEEKKAKELEKSHEEFESWWAVNRASYLKEHTGTVWTEDELKNFLWTADIAAEKLKNEQKKLLEDLKTEEIEAEDSYETVPIFFDSIHQLSRVSSQIRVSFNGLVSGITDLRNAEIQSDTHLKMLEITVSDQSGSIGVNIFGTLAEKIARTIINGRQISIENGLLRVTNYFSKSEIMCYKKSRVSIKLI